MSEYIALLRATLQGVPNTGQPPRHFVRFSPRASLHIVPQMAAGGRYPNEDCGDADLRSLLLDDGYDVPVRTIERLSGTDSGGTSLAGLIAAARALGYDARFLAANPPPGLNGMNSAWGGFIPAAQMGPYYAACVAQTIVLDRVQPVDNRKPTSGTPESNQPPTRIRRMNIIFWAVVSAGVAAFQSDGMSWRHIDDEKVLLELDTLGTEAGLPPYHYNTSNSASTGTPQFFELFGVPRNQHSANVAGLPFP